MRDPLDDIEVAVVAPRPNPAGATWPPRPIQVKGSITFRMVRALSPAEFEELERAGTLEYFKEELRRSVWTSVLAWLDPPA